MPNQQLLEQYRKMNGLMPPMAHASSSISSIASSMGTMASMSSSFNLSHHTATLAAHVASSSNTLAVVGGLHHHPHSSLMMSHSSSSTVNNHAAHTNGNSHHQEAVIEIPPEVVPSLAHIPLKSYMIKDFPFNINCKGCNKAFPCYYTPKGFKKIPAPAYYVHCIDDCPDYRAKGFIKECEVCSFKFLDKQSLGIHKNSCRSTNKRAMLAKKPKWMPYSILLTIINYSKFDGRIDCRGCKRKFPCYRNGTKVVPSLEYYVHCIEECKDYRDKGWIQKCSQCKCKFLNTISLIQHMKGCFK